MKFVIVGRYTGNMEHDFSFCDLMTITVNFLNIGLLHSVSFLDKFCRSDSVLVVCITHIFYPVICTDSWIPIRKPLIISQETGFAISLECFGCRGTRLYYM